MESNNKQLQSIWSEEKNNQEFLISTQVDIDLIRCLFDRIGLRYGVKTEHEIRQDKLHQVVDYLVQIIAAIRKMSTKRSIVLMDCCSGMSYLSFAANYYCTEVLGRDVRFICVDSRADLMEKCSKIHLKLGYGNMEFHQSTITDYEPDCKVDIVYSLHACDMATDQTIALGIQSKAKFIMTVACCQRTVRKQIRMPWMINGSKDSKERLADLIADTMRSKILESLGYKTRLFEYSTARYSPKNMMLRAELVNGSTKNKLRAWDEYLHLLGTFHVKPAIEEYLPELGGG